MPWLISKSDSSGQKDNRPARAFLTAVMRSASSMAIMAGMLGPNVMNILGSASIGRGMRLTNPAEEAVFSHLRKQVLNRSGVANASGPPCTPNPNSAIQASASVDSSALAVPCPIMSGEVHPWLQLPTLDGSTWLLAAMHSLQKHVGGPTISSHIGQITISLHPVFLLSMGLIPCLMENSHTKHLWCPAVRWIPLGVTNWNPLGGGLSIRTRISPRATLRALASAPQRMGTS